MTSRAILKRLLIAMALGACIALTACGPSASAGTEVQMPSASEALTAEASTEAVTEEIRPACASTPGSNADPLCGVVGPECGPGETLLQLYKVTTATGASVPTSEPFCGIESVGAAGRLSGESPRRVPIAPGDIRSTAGPR
ncbi:hypothetical protein [Arthrobacter cavernae]|uniref:Uncharacterized protein n=1 Tax=Arthrobacter cavernae TaxID=2817681 RepID=A0A939HCG2_9MICC|nr:hypothetical protein [Arthrobacter cavernae]MBO1266614.1 hypothetical protein [Arthrobacter cavernae]